MAERRHRESHLPVNPQSLRPCGVKQRKHAQSTTLEIHVPYGVRRRQAEGWLGPHHRVTVNPASRAKLLLGRLPETIRTLRRTRKETLVAMDTATAKQHGQTPVAGDPEDTGGER